MNDDATTTSLHGLRGQARVILRPGAEGGGARDDEVPFRDCGQGLNAIETAILCEKRRPVPIL